MKVDTDLLCTLALEKVSALEHKIKAGLVEDIGILRHEDAEYIWRLKWQKDGTKLDFIMEVHTVVRPKNPRHRPKLALASSNNFKHTLEA